MAVYEVTFTLSGAARSVTRSHIREVHGSLTVTVEAEDEDRAHARAADIVEHWLECESVEVAKPRCPDCGMSSFHLASCHLVGQEGAA